jgi:hypothetical protein
MTMPTFTQQECVDLEEALLAHLNVWQKRKSEIELRDSRNYIAYVGREIERLTTLLDKVSTARKAPTTTLESVKGALTAINVAEVEGLTCAAVNCRDYDHYKGLPEVVSHNGRLLGKTGWNSDTGHAYYQDNATVLRDVR